MLSFGDLAIWLDFGLLFKMNQKPVKNWFRTGFKPVLYKIGASSKIRSKNVTLKNMLKTGLKLILIRFLRIVDFGLLLANDRLLLFQHFWQHWL